MIADMVERVRKAVGVSATYDADEIPNGIRRAMLRLLRDYHFPKAVVKHSYTNLFLNSQEYTLPEGFKKELQLRFFDPAENAWSEPLRKREGFEVLGVHDLPYADTYWLEGNKLHTNRPLDVSAVGLSLVLWHESMDTAAAESWFTTDFEDLLFTFSVMRIAVELRKPEVAQIFASLWQEDKSSLAVYLNELEFDNLHMQWREPEAMPAERYPA